MSTEPPAPRSVVAIVASYRPDADLVATAAQLRQQFDQVIVVNLSLGQRALHGAGSARRNPGKRR